MATCSVVNVLCPNGRRQKVKLSPQMTLHQVIQEVCKKQSLNPNNCTLRHQRKMLDSSLTVRFANLPNNAHLELVETAEEKVHQVKKCIVALQLESGDRLVYEFNSDDTLFKILVHWKSQSQRIKFDDSADGVVCIYASQEIRGLEKLQSTTLSMIGLNGGRGVVRLILPSPVGPAKDESDMMEGVCDKLVPELNKSDMPPTSNVAARVSTEEMEVASGCSSNVSMTSQASDDYNMQCAETITEPIMHCEKTDFPNQSDVESTSKSRKEKKTGKGHEVASAMEVEQGEQEGDLRETAVEDPQVSPSLPSGASTSQSAPTIQVFAGVGRSLSETGPEIKKARLSLPPSAPNKKNGDSSLDNKVQNEKDNDHYQSDREAVVFRLGEGRALSSDEISDEFFEVTVDDLRLMLRDLKNERTSEAPLMTKSMREEREKTKTDQYEKVAIRVNFPDGTVLQGFFSPKERVSAVNSFVRDNLEERDTDFYLCTEKERPDCGRDVAYDAPKSVLMNEVLAEFCHTINVQHTPAKLVPAAVIHFGIREPREFYLNSRVMQKITSVSEANEKVEKHHRPSTSSSSPDQAAAGLTSANNNTNDKNKQSIELETPSSSLSDSSTVNSRDNNGRGVNKATPKWFKLGKFNEKDSSSKHSTRPSFPCDRENVASKITSNGLVDKRGDLCEEDASTSSATQTCTQQILQNDHSSRDLETKKHPLKDDYKESHENEEKIPLCCPVCHAVFFGKNDHRHFFRHFLENHVKETYICLQCTAVTDSWRKMERHFLRTRHPVTCPFCETTLPSKDFFAHWFKDHRETTGKGELGSWMVRSIVCPYPGCPKKSCSIQAASDHYLVKHDGPKKMLHRLACKECWKTTQKVDEAVAHYIKDHHTPTGLARDRLEKLLASEWPFTGTSEAVSTTGKEPVIRKRKASSPTISHASTTSTTNSLAESKPVPKRRKTTPVSQLSGKEVQLPCAENLSKFALIIFIDLDNWKTFFQISLEIPVDAFVWGFCGENYHFTEAMLLVLREHQAGKRFFLHPMCGATQNAADFALCIQAAKLDLQLPKQISFAVLSGDKGFGELRNQLSSSSRKVHLVNPHHKDLDIVYAMLKRMEGT